MRSVGIELESWAKRGLLRFHCDRPTSLGLELLLATMHKLAAEFEPRLVIVDAITDFNAAGTASEAGAMLARLIDFLKMRKTTALFTSLERGDGAADRTDAGVSSLIDTWLLLSNLQTSGELNRQLCILKSRGMAHSNQVKRLVLDDRGVRLIDGNLDIQGSRGLDRGDVNYPATRRRQVQTRGNRRWNPKIPHGIAEQ